MQPPIFSFPHLSCFKFLSEENIGYCLQAISDQAGSCVDVRSPFMCCNPMAHVDICWPHGQEEMQHSSHVAFG